MSIRKTFSKSIALTMINSYDKGVRSRFQKCLDMFTKLLFEKWSETEIFLDMYLTTFLKSVISEIQNIWGSPFFPKCPKFKLVFRNAAKNWEKVFLFWNNYVIIGIVELSLLRTGYLSLAANVWTSSSNICCFKKTDFFQLSCLDTDQYIW